MQKYLRDLNNNPELSLKTILSDWAEREWIQVDKDGNRTADVKVEGKNRKMVKVLLGAPDLPQVIEYMAPIEITDDGIILTLIYDDDRVQLYRIEGAEEVWSLDKDIG